MDDLSQSQAKFTAMTEGTQEDWAVISSHFMGFATSVGNRVLDHLRLLDGDYGGFPVDRLTYCLQTATRAHRDGRDEQYVVMALIHDIGDTLGTRSTIPMSVPQSSSHSYPKNIAGFANSTVFSKAIIISTISEWTATCASIIAAINISKLAQSSAKNMTKRRSTRTMTQHPCHSLNLWFNAL
jgi:hypothetical protein